MGLFRHEDSQETRQPGQRMADSTLEWGALARSDFGILGRILQGARTCPITSDTDCGPGRRLRCPQIRARRPTMTPKFSLATEMVPSLSVGGKPDHAPESRPSRDGVVCASARPAGSAKLRKGNLWNQRANDAKVFQLDKLRFAEANPHDAISRAHGCFARLPGVDADCR
jgi:hypothetical protein